VRLSETQSALRGKIDCMITGRLLDRVYLP
jgi:hypothetical protein